MNLKFHLYMIYFLFIGAFLFAPVMAGLNDYPGSESSNNLDQIKETIQGYEAVFNAATMADFDEGANQAQLFANIFAYFSPETVGIPGNSPQFSGSNWSGIEGAFGAIFSSLGEYGIPPWDVKIVHSYETYGSSGDYLMARLILQIKDKSTDEVLDTYNCTFEFELRNGKPDPSKYVVSYVHFSPVAKDSLGADTIANPATP